MKLLIVLSIFLFAVYPTLMDAFCLMTAREWQGLSTIGIHGNQWGYNIVNFILMYMVGAYLRLGECRLKSMKTSGLIIMLLCCIGVMTL